MKMNDNIFEKLYEFHGHVCLMSTAGVRIALAAMRAIGLNKSDEFLFAFYHAKTCAIDPIQFITGCTLGNSNIIVDESIKMHLLKLVRQSDGTGVSVILKDEVLARMKACMQAKKAGETGAIEEFVSLLDALRSDPEETIVEVSPFTMDIKPYLRF